jgi:hypothetical protein
VRWCRSLAHQIVDVEGVVEVCVEEDVVEGPVVQQPRPVRYNVCDHTRTRTRNASL